MTNNTKPIIHDPDLEKVDSALKRAALRAREIAKRTNTQIVIFENGKTVRKSPD